ncbi:trypsin-1-like [Schistocerca serialis cubense]|uniref:trypsin-1-like n=1 Tax=Schistocerca serialis cubense TaxID=2023355 RepID=UPI00214DF515|nr:trypsin-1-like [Schistocerca serialis cubense]
MAASRHFQLLASALLTLVCFRTGADAAPRIVNGTDADIKDYPFMVSVWYRGAFNCGGSLLSSSWVLSAAHCMAGVQNASVLSVLAGTATLSGGGQRRMVRQAVRHEQYDLKADSPRDVPPLNDVGLLLLESPLELGAELRPVSLPGPQQAVSAGTSALVMGWGYAYTNSGVVMDRLQVAEVSVYSLSDCYRVLDGALNPTNLCAGAPEGGRGQCTGDSGGPLLVSGGVQVGVVSWSLKPCASRGLPAAFADVSLYVEWIHQHTGHL